jgi:uncharacterized protein
MSSITCPKCESPMRSYERSGVMIDRCSECGGLFLDRGEVERLIEAEARYGGDGNERFESFEQPRGRDHDDDDHRYYEQDPRRRRRRKGGFLGDLFEFGD